MIAARSGRGTGFGAALLIAALAGACGGGGGEGERSPRVLSPDTLHAWMAAARPVALLDIQPDSLYHIRRLSGAVPAHGYKVHQLRAVLPVDPTVPIVIYNEDGVRPPREADLAHEAAVEYGFPIIYWLDGGVRAWAERGYNLDGYRRFPER